eukprot:GEMP01078815.1.p1 GENE.GEMP01078815.1~~GEMP01078815.1.p1  ORF type:complete len:151 (+),score=32.74 GEMP01078815.1:467-919(+)
MLASSDDAAQTAAVNDSAATAVKNSVPPETGMDDRIKASTSADISDIGGFDSNSDGDAQEDGLNNYGQDLDAFWEKYNSKEYKMAMREVHQDRRYYEQILESRAKKQKAVRPKKSKAKKKLQWVEVLVIEPNDPCPVLMPYHIVRIKVKI